MRAQLGHADGLCFGQIPGLGWIGAQVEKFGRAASAGDRVLVILDQLPIAGADGPSGSAVASGVVVGG